MKEEEIEKILNETFKIGPFLLELFKEENMIHPLVLKQLDTLVSDLEVVVKRDFDNYSSLKTYFKGHPDTFRFKQGDIALFKEISQTFKAIVAQSGGTIIYPKKTGYTLLDLIIQQLEEKRTIYTKKLKELCLLLFLKGGPATYNLLSTLLPLPCLSLIRRELGSIENVEEGSLRVQELKTFLVANQLPLQIWLSEDATRCITQIEHDTKADKFVGR